MDIAWCEWNDSYHLWSSPPASVTKRQHDMDDKVFASVRMTDNIQTPELFGNIQATNGLLPTRRRRKYLKSRLVVMLVLAATGACILYQYMN
jgi:hypothetical protein